MTKRSRKVSTKHSRRPRRSKSSSRKTMKRTKRQSSRKHTSKKRKSKTKSVRKRKRTKMNGGTLDEQNKLAEEYEKKNCHKGTMRLTPECIQLENKIDELGRNQR